MRLTHHEFMPVAGEDSRPTDLLCVTGGPQAHKPRGQPKERADTQVRPYGFFIRTLVGAVREPPCSQAIFYVPFNISLRTTRYH